VKTNGKTWMIAAACSELPPALRNFTVIDARIRVEQGERHAWRRKGLPVEHDLAAGR